MIDVVKRQKLLLIFIYAYTIMNLSRLIKQSNSMNISRNRAQSDTIFNYHDHVAPQDMNYLRNAPVRLAIGHYEIASGHIFTEYIMNDGRTQRIEYMSMREAIERQLRGELIELHFSDSAIDQILLEKHRESARATRSTDMFVDYWYCSENRYRRPIAIADPNLPYIPIPNTDYEPVKGFPKIFA